MEKVRISAKIDENVLKESERLLEAANCKNISEYIRKAIETYNEYILDPNNEKWKPLAVKTLEKSISKMQKRVARLMFKQEVEIAKCFWLAVSQFDIEPEDVDEMHAYCVEELKHIDGEMKI